MKWFMLKAFLFTSLMFLVVLLGMQQANDGITKMKGYNDSNFKDAFTLQESETGELHASILGNDVTSHDLKQKKEKLEEMKAYNFFSSIGRKLSNGLSTLAENVIYFITDHLQKL